MLISNNVKFLANDLVKNFNEWQINRHTIDRKSLRIWIANGLFFINLYPDIPGMMKFNLFEKFILYRAIKKCAVLNFNKIIESQL